MDRSITKSLKDICAPNAYIDAKKFNSKADSLDGDISDLMTDVLEFVGQKGYPCVGAQASIMGRTFAVGKFESMNEPNSSLEVAVGLYHYLDTMYARPSNFLTYIAIFPDTEIDGELAFEEKLWSLLNDLHKIDSEYFKWNPDVSRNPNSPEFSFSFGGKAFFMVGLHPRSSRKARRFKHPAIAFNLQEQFDDLREKGRFEIMQDAIREREIDFDGSVNPMLADFGEGLQAPQYSGRKVGKEWKCPFGHSN